MVTPGEGFDSVDSDGIYCGRVNATDDEIVEENEVHEISALLDGVVQVSIAVQIVDNDCKYLIVRQLLAVFVSRFGTP